MGLQVSAFRARRSAVEAQLLRQMHPTQGIHHDGASCDPCQILLSCANAHRLCVASAVCVHDHPDHYPLSWAKALGKVHVKVPPVD